MQARPHGVTDGVGLCGLIISELCLFVRFS